MLFRLLCNRWRDKINETSSWYDIKNIIIIPQYRNLYSINFNVAKCILFSDKNATNQSIKSAIIGECFYLLFFLFFFCF